ncbi:hypothetical protein MASR2M117_10260 [Paludibacter sp.]
MKRKFLISLIVLASVTVFSQNSVSKFAYGISTDFLSVPLNKDLQIRSTNVYVTYCPIKNLNLKIGYDALLLQDVNQKKYEDQSALLLGAGYTVLRDKTGNFSTEVFLSGSNGFKKFSSFSNFHTDLGVKFMLLDAFYIGTGVRFNSYDTNVVFANQTNSANLFMQLGLQLNIGKNKL